MFQMAILLLKNNNCAKLFWNPCISVQLMARTCLVYYYFIISPSSVTLTFNLPEPMFRMALLLLKDNYWAKLFLKSMHKCTTYGSYKPDLQPFHHLTFKSDFDLQPTATTVSNGTSAPQERYLCQIASMNNLWPGQARFTTILSFDLQVWLWPSTYSNNCFKWHFNSSRTISVPNYLEIHASMNNLWPGHAQLMTILSFDLKVWPWPSTYRNNCFKWHFYSSRTIPVQTYLEIHALMYKLWPGLAQLMTILLFHLPKRPWSSTFLNKCFKWHFYSSRTTNVPNCFEIYAQIYKWWPRQSWMDPRMHNTHTSNWNYNCVSLTASRLDKKGSIHQKLLILEMV